MSLFGNSLKINCFIKLHVLGVDSEDLKSADLIRNTNVDLSVEPAEPSKSWVKGVRSVGGSNNDNVSSCFEAVHQSKQLRNNSPLDFTMYLFSVGGNGVDLIDEDDGWTVLLSFFESFS